MDAKKREIRTIECDLAVREIEGAEGSQGESRTITGTAIVFNAESEVLDDWGVDFREIIKLELNKTVKKLEDIGHELTYGEDVVDYILDKISTEKEYGARPIMRVIQEDIENQITDFILENEGTNFKFSVNRLNLTGDDDKILLRVAAEA